MPSKLMVLFFYVGLILSLNYGFAHAECDRGATQIELNICSDLEYKKADEGLNKTYQKALKILTDKNEKGLFVQSQRAWIKYRDSTCKFEIAGYEGGSIQPLIYSECMKRLTTERTKEIPNSFQEWDSY
jgi:uncharacterized protein YecT (DUF1311 family)